MMGRGLFVYLFVCFVCFVCFVLFCVTVGTKQLKIYKGGSQLHRLIPGCVYRSAKTSSLRQWLISID